MLCLGPGSVCDVCLEPFGNDHKAPCSIDCGHVFCLDCLNHTSRSNATCPLCRTPFVLGNHVKLHVDLDSLRGGSPPSPACEAADAATLQEARRLQDGIASIVIQGSSEGGFEVGALIQDCKAFFSRNSKAEFHELHVKYRMVKYMFEVKTRLREKERLLEPLQASVNVLQAEKAELLDKFTKSETQRRDDRERALVVEMNLRHHYEQTQASYNDLVKMYQQAIARIDKMQSVTNPMHHVPDEWEHRQAQQLKNFPPVIHIKASPDSCSSCGSISPEDQGFLISPLPEFTSSTLPISAFTPLPDDDNCHDPKLQPLSILESVSQYPDLTENNLLDSPRPSPAFGSTASPSLLSMTAPKRVETRTVRSQSFPTASRPSSRPPTCPSSPAPALARATLHSASSTADLTSGSIPSIGIGIPAAAPRDPDRLRTRLRDLLDTNIPSMSSSLPNPSHIPSSSPAGGAGYISRADSRHTPQSGSRRNSPPPYSSRSEGPNSLSHSVPILNQGGPPNAVPIPISSSLTNPPASLQQQQNPPAPRSTMMSHASAAAQALERVQKEERNRDREYRSRMAAGGEGAPLPAPPLPSKPSPIERPTLSRSTTQVYPPPPLDRSSRVSPTRERERTPSNSNPPTTTRGERDMPPPPQPSSAVPIIKPMTSTTMTTMTSASSASSVPRERDPSSHRHHHHHHHVSSATGSIGQSKGKLISSTIPPMYA